MRNKLQASLLWDVINTNQDVLDLLRSALMAHWLTSTWNHPVVQFLGIYDRITTGMFAASIIPNVVKTIELGESAERFTDSIGFHFCLLGRLPR